VDLVPQARVLDDSSVHSEGLVLVVVVADDDEEVAVAAAGGREDGQFVVQ